MKINKGEICLKCTHKTNSNLVRAGSKPFRSALITCLLAAVPELEQVPQEKKSPPEQMPPELMASVLNIFECHFIGFVLNKIYLPWSLVHNMNSTKEQLKSVVIDVNKY